MLRAAARHRGWGCAAGLLVLGTVGPPAAAQAPPTLADCERPTGAFSLTGSFSQAGVLNGQVQDSPCPAAVAGSTPAGDGAKTLFACHFDGMVMCDGDGSSGANPTTPAACAPVDPLGSASWSDMGCLILRSVVLSTDGSKLFAACQSKVYRCDWSPTAGGTVTSCTVQDFLRCSGSGQMWGVARALSGDLLLSCYAEQDAASAGLLLCPMDAAGQLSGVGSQTCQKKGEIPCGVIGMGWYQQAAVQVGPWGLIGGCHTDGYVSCTTYTVQNGAAACSRGLPGTKPPSCNEISAVEVVPSGKTSLCCGSNEYWLCGSPAPTSAPADPPSTTPTAAPTGSPAAPSVPPTRAPSGAPSASPSAVPTVSPSPSPSAAPSPAPSAGPSTAPSAAPSPRPSAPPTGRPSVPPTRAPSQAPTGAPTGPPARPSAAPSQPPTVAPSAAPTSRPSAAPSARPSAAPSDAPTARPSLPPTLGPSARPSGSPTARPSLAPSPGPSAAPSGSPTSRPSAPPSQSPSAAPSGSPTSRPSTPPSQSPSGAPSGAPTARPSVPPSLAPSVSPTTSPSGLPSTAPSAPPSAAPSPAPSARPLPPTAVPSVSPSPAPSVAPSGAPSRSPSTGPSAAPSPAPTPAPAASPTVQPSAPPTRPPRPAPTLPPIAPGTPTSAPATADPSQVPTLAPTSSPSSVPLRPSTAPSAPPQTLGQPTLPPAPPSAGPSLAPSAGPSAAPRRPSQGPSAAPSVAPSATPSAAPSEAPQTAPSAAPSQGDESPQYLDEARGVMILEDCALDHQGAIPGDRLRAGVTLCAMRIQGVAGNLSSSGLLRAMNWKVSEPRPGGFESALRQPGFVRVTELRAAARAAHTLAETRSITADIQLGPWADFAVWGSGRPERVALRFDPSAFPAGVSPKGAELNFTVSAKQPIPESVKQTQEGVKATAAAVAAVSALSSASPSGNVAKLAMLMDINCEDGGEGEADDAMDWTMHPLGFEAAGSLYAGALVGNGLLLVLFLLLHFCIVKILVAAGKCGAGAKEADGATDLERVAGKARFPSLVYLPFAFLFQGNMFAGAKLLATADSDHPWRLVVGIGSTLVLIAHLGHVIWMTNVSKGYFQAEYTLDEEPRVGRCVPLRDFLLGRAAWTSTGGAFVERWGEIFDCWRPPWHRFLVVELGHMVPLTFLAVRDLGTWSACAVNAWLMTAVLTVYLLAVLLPRPYIAQFENACMVVECLLQVVAMALLAVGFHSEDVDSGAFAAAGSLMVAAMLVMLCKTVYDVVAFAMSLCEGQRERLSEQALKRSCAPLGLEGDAPLEGAAGVSEEDDDCGDYAQLAALFRPTQSPDDCACTPPAPHPRRGSHDDCPTPAVGDLVLLGGLAAHPRYNGAQAEVIKVGEGEQRKVRVCTVSGPNPGKVLRVNRSNCSGPHRREWDRRRRSTRSDSPRVPLEGNTLTLKKMQLGTDHQMMQLGMDRHRSSTLARSAPGRRSPRRPGPSATMRLETPGEAVLSFSSSPPARFASGPDLAVDPVSPLLRAGAAEHSRKGSTGADVRRKGSQQPGPRRKSAGAPRSDARVTVSQPQRI